MGERPTRKSGVNGLVSMDGGEMMVMVTTDEHDGRHIIINIKMHLDKKK